MDIFFGGGGIGIQSFPEFQKNSWVSASFGFKQQISWLSSTIFKIQTKDVANRWGPKDWVDGERVPKVLSGGRMPTESPKKALLRESGGGW